MSRKVGAVSEETRARLLQVAAEEISEVGFQKASLRKICAKAGVTTGALYFFFDGKDDLLANIISPLCAQVMDYVTAHYGPDAHERHQGFFASEEEDHKAIEGLYRLLMDNAQVGTIILENRQHEAVQEFFERIVACLVQYLESVIEVAYPEMVESNLNDEYTMRWLAHLQLDAFLGLFSLGMDEDELWNHVNLVARSFRGGFTALLLQAS